MFSQDQKENAIHYDKYSKLYDTMQKATGFNDLAAFDDAIKSVELQIRKIHEKDKSHDRQTLRTMKVDLSE